MLLKKDVDFLILEENDNKERVKINDSLIDYQSNEEVCMKGASSFLMRNFKFGKIGLNLLI